MIHDIRLKGEDGILKCRVKAEALRETTGGDDYHRCAEGIFPRDSQETMRCNFLKVFVARLVAKLFVAFHALEMPLSLIHI